jgi:multidrug efflux pump subunit AcrA (membrane-fusion protein)
MGEENMSKVQKRYLLIGGAFGLIVLALIVGAVRPSKKALGAQPITPDVEIVQVEKKDVPIYGEWIGTLDGLVNADVRAQVTGYLLKQGYQEGTFVKQGDLLFQIDPRPFRQRSIRPRASWPRLKQLSPMRRRCSAARNLMSNVIRH